jgi:hypothetical protein
MILEIEKTKALKLNSNKRVMCLCDDCGTQFDRQFQLLNRQPKHRCYQCARKNIGKTMNRKRIDEATRSRSGENHPRWNPNKSKFLCYANQVRWISEKIYKNNQQVINPHGHIRTTCGVPGGYQLDHRVSVKEGFEKKISVHEIASINNLQMLPWQANRAKGA